MTLSVAMTGNVMNITGADADFPPPFQPPINSLFNITDRGTQYRYLEEGWTESSADIGVTVLPLGAKGDGQTDDTAAIQGALDYVDSMGGGTVFLPKGSYRITSTLVVNTSSTFKTINLIGAGMLATQLQWYGSTSGIAIRVNGLKQYIFEGWLLDNKVAVGTTVGVRVLRDTGTGTQSGSCAWRNIILRGFDKGLHLGNAAGAQATSEYLFDHLKLENNTIGCLIEQSNSLDFVFNMLELGANGTGVQVTSGGVVSVNGGSASGSTAADFDFQPGGSFAIHDFRSETGNRFLIGGNTSAGTPILVSGCTVKAITNGDGYGIRCSSGPIVLIGNDLLCKVACSGQANAATVAIGNAIADANTVDFSTIGGSGAQYSFFGNRQVDTANSNVAELPAEVGFTAAGVKVPSFKVDTTGLLNTKASVAGGAGFRLPHGTAPTSPADGDIWTTTAGLFVRVNGVTVGPLS